MNYYNFGHSTPDTVSKSDELPNPELLIAMLSVLGIGTNSNVGETVTFELCIFSSSSCNSQSGSLFSEFGLSINVVGSARLSGLCVNAITPPIMITIPNANTMIEGKPLNSFHSPNTTNPAVVATRIEHVD